MEPSPHAIKRGCPSTQVMRWCWSPGMAYLGYGQKRADGELESTFDGHLKPTTAEMMSGDYREIRIVSPINSINHLLDCKCEAVDLASCIHGCVHRMLDHHHSDVEMVHREHISNK